MATTRTAAAHWEGSLMEGSGQVELQSSGTGTFDVSWPARAEAANGQTSPEDLTAAAPPTSYPMALSHALALSVTPPT
jgi:osmotically inducible protein OsmC